MKESKVADSWPLQDGLAVQHRIREIVAAATELSPFEGAFLTETLRMAIRFKTTFRLSPKQVAVLDELHDRFVLPAEIDAKINKTVVTPQSEDEPTCPVKRRTKSSKP